MRTPAGRLPLFQWVVRRSHTADNVFGQNDPREQTGRHIATRQAAPVPAPRPVRAHDRAGCRYFGRTIRRLKSFGGTISDNHLSTSLPRRSFRRVLGRPARPPARSRSFPGSAGARTLPRARCVAALARARVPSRAAAWRRWASRVSPTLRAATRAGRDPVARRSTATIRRPRVSRCPAAACRPRPPF
jgi:hypothetical protein